MEPKTIYITIGNSDDKLTQAQWATFVADVDAALDAACEFEDTVFHGNWLSPSQSPYQNACWCLTLSSLQAEVALRQEMLMLVKKYGQESITWASAQVEFLRLSDPTLVSQEGSDDE